MGRSTSTWPARERDLRKLLRTKAGRASGLEDPGVACPRPRGAGSRGFPPGTLAGSARATRCSAVAGLCLDSKTVRAGSSGSSLTCSGVSSRLGASWKPRVCGRSVRRARGPQLCRWHLEWGCGGGLAEDFAFDLRGPPRLWGVGVRIEPDHRSPSWCQRIGVGTTREEPRAPANPMGVPALWDQRGRPGTWLGGAVSLGH